MLIPVLHRELFPLRRGVLGSFREQDQSVPGRLVQNVGKQGCVRECVCLLPSCTGLTFRLSLSCFRTGDELGASLGSEGEACLLLSERTEPAPGDSAQRRSMGSASCSCTWELWEGGAPERPERREDTLAPPLHPSPGPPSRLYFRPSVAPSGVSAPQEQGVCFVYCSASACWNRACAHLAGSEC